MQVHGSQHCTNDIIHASLFSPGVLLLTGLDDLSLPSDADLGVQVPGLPPVSLLPDLSYLAPNCFHPSQKLHAKSKFIQIDDDENDRVLYFF